jgi:hypothetical protein
MPESDLSSLSQLSPAPDKESVVKRSDWLISASFGDALKRSFYLLQRQFRWYVFIFFLGGVILAVSVFPINAVIATIEYRIVSEILTLFPDFFYLVNLLMLSQILQLFVNFFGFFGFFVLSTITVYYAVRRDETLQLLVKEPAAVHFPISQVIGGGLATAAILTAVSIIPFLVPFFQVFFFFIPAVLIIDTNSLKKVFGQSIQMRRRYWQRILGALILSYLFMLFASRLGITVYLNIETIFNQFRMIPFSISLALDFVGPLLLILISQLPVAMVAPILPLLSIAFYAGAKNTQRQIRYEAYTQWIQKQQS